jgi:argininosuccinate lyase
MVYRSKGVGGPQLSEVERMLADDRAKLTTDLSWLNSRKDRLATAESLLDKAVAALAITR